MLPPLSTTCVVQRPVYKCNSFPFPFYFITNMIHTYTSTFSLQFIFKSTQEFQNTAPLPFCCVFIYNMFWILSSRAHFISHCWLRVWFHPSVLFLCLAVAMFAKLFLFDKHTIIGMFIVVKNNHNSIETLVIEIRRKQENTKRIQEMAVDFKGISTFCTTILWSLQWVWQTLHISWGPFIYYVITCRGGEGSENANFWLFSVLKTCLHRGGGGSKNPENVIT